MHPACLLLVAALAAAGAAANSDVPGQLRDLKNAFTTAPPQPASLAPALKKRLDGRALSSLSPALQRALLWDAGQIYTGAGARYVDLYVLCGQTTNNVFLSVAGVANADCPLKDCKQFTMNIAKATCEAASLESRALCAVVGDDQAGGTGTGAAAGMMAYTGPLWAQEGNVDADFAPRIYQNAIDASSNLYVISQSGDFAGVKDKCGSTPSFVVPCCRVARSEVTEAFEEKKWCRPQTQLGVDSWYANETASNSSTSGSGNVTDGSTAGSSTNGEGNTDSGSPGVGAGGIIGIVAGVLVLIGVIAFFVVRKRRHNAANQSAYHSRNMDSLPMASQNGTWNDPAIIAHKIPLEKVQTQALVSRGGFGEVYRGLYKGQTVAIKKLLPATCKDLKHIEGFFAEVKLMIALEHTRIVQFIGVAWDSLSGVCVLTEFMDGGDLRTLLTRFEVQEQRAHGFDADKVKIALHVVHALTYLHSLQPIVLHRDLKSKNILLDSQLNAKLTDFGVSREQSDRTMTAGVGTSLWMAPEVMMGGRYDEKSDIFSFGVVLSELDSHLLPYAHAKNPDTGNKLTDTAILQLVSMGRLRVEFSELVAPELQELGEACVAVDPSDRPTAVEVLYKLQLALKATKVQ